MARRPRARRCNRMAAAQQQLVGMGYNAGEANVALHRANGDIGRAVEVLCGGGLDDDGDPDAANDETFGDTSRRANVDEWMNGGEGEHLVLWPGGAAIQVFCNNTP